MTEKQESIVQAALELFAEHGYDAVPTSKIAKRAGVSEGLIFRHFENKLGLLEAVMNIGRQRIEEELDLLKAVNDPQEVIQRIMEAPFQIDESEYPYWRLVYALKFNENYYDSSASEPIYELLVQALRDLKYDNAEMEAHLILSYVDGFMMTLLLKSDFVDQEALLATLRSKYISNT